MVATRFPDPRVRAIRKAAQIIAPLDIPTKRPSSRANLRANGKASSSQA
jgi:hypothetical protein